MDELDVLREKKHMKKPLVVAILHGSIYLLSSIILEFASHGPGGGIVLAFLFVGLGGLAYLLPSYIAALRDAPRFSSILGLNILAGWTGLGWIATLIWSFVDTKKESPQVIIQNVYTGHQTPPPMSPQEK